MIDCQNLAQITPKGSDRRQTNALEITDELAYFMTLKKHLKQSASFAVLALTLTAPLAAETVQLRSPDGAFNVEGELRNWDDDSYVISVGGADMTVFRSQVECIGAACPTVQVDPALPPTDIVIRGSDTIGDDLMPMLVNGYARSLGATQSDVVPSGPDTTMNIFPETSSFPGLAAEIQAAGSSTGFKALIAREADIGMSSRPAREKEVTAIADQGRGNLLDVSQEYIIAVDSILTIVSPQNPISSLSMQQMADVFSGNITNWSQLGGANAPIRVITRPDTSGTRGVFEDAILKPAGLEMSSRAVVIGSNEDIADAVAADPNAIGYVGFAYKDEAKAVNIVSNCGILMSASAFSSKTEEYPLERRLRLFVDNAPMDDVKRGLLDFAVSQAADPFVHEAGFIDLAVAPDESGASTQRILDIASQVLPPNERALGQNLIDDLTGAQRLTTTFRFKTASAELDNKAIRDLGRMRDFLARPENRGKEVIVAGFADSVGAFSFNRQLAQARADVVYGALRSVLGDTLDQAGIKMHAESYSELSPVGCNDTPRGRERNRRVEIWLR